jgi:hypothetical protein
VVVVECEHERRERVIDQADLDALLDRVASGLAGREARRMSCR